MLNPVNDLHRSILVSVWTLVEMTNQNTNNLPRCDVQNLLIFIYNMLPLISLVSTLGAVVIPPHAPDVWGGAAYGPTLGHSSHIFAFSGADGPTSEGI